MKGFITIATGPMRYYELAANLLRSYRHFTKDPLPFAIIAEEHNEYTALFDDVIITTESTHSYTDKFLLLKLCPYDETIFIDADSLAFDDLNKLFKLFENSTDFSAVGSNCDLEDKTQAWYDIEDLGDYGKNLTYKCRIHAGLCFIRNSEKTKKMYNDSMELFHNYDKLHFHKCSRCIDECVLAVAMTMNQMFATQEKVEYLAVLPYFKKAKANIYRSQLSVETVWGTSCEKGTLVHFGTNHTLEPLYIFNIKCLKKATALKEGRKETFIDLLLYKWEWLYAFLRLKHEISIYLKIIKNKLHRIFKKEN